MRLTTLLALGTGLLFSHAAGAAEPLPQRWVSAGGSLSEWVVVLGGESRLVGVDSTSQHPQSLQTLPGIGYQRALAAEGILALHPDILIGSEEMGPPPVLEQIKAGGVRVELLSAKASLATLEDNLNRLGALLGVPQQASQQLDAYRKRLQRQAAWVNQAQRQQVAPQVLMLLGHAGSSPMAAGKDTLAAWMIEQAGGRNLTSHLGYKALSSEALLALDPQVLIIADRRLQGDAARAALLEQNPALAQTAAVRDGRLLLLDPTLLVGGLGPRLPDGLAVLSAAFYPAAQALTAEAHR
ncbi:ABC transporter substrate-binding protein [Pseudomonas alcaligenes]|uniref:ABC transporter substrate-binding protein n=1 Tax=Aquipseudomonas alcaligenes TaxID=43263 RepID=A0ABR7RYR1_AQUAC|nr:ABC transporter substrate-binding protein [Pseudomonas alcaligenes]MBC9249466.1 ABC transporter substrate-binding protein [Pseudomonas alcaligenes]